MDVHAAIIGAAKTQARSCANAKVPCRAERARRSRKISPMDSVKSEIAATAARMVVEEGLEYGPAKRRAIKQLGLGTRAPLPDNSVLEDAVREYLALFCAETQPAELAALRTLALTWMERMGQFRPYLGGAVWHGTATRLSDIYIQLFCDDSKSAEIALIEHKVDYQARTVTGFNGEPVEALSLSSHSPILGEAIGVHLMVYDHDDVRGALKPDARGRPPRGDLAAVRTLLQTTSSPAARE
jgi:hypothetical protein